LLLILYTNESNRQDIRDHLALLHQQDIVSDALYHDIQHQAKMYWEGRHPTVKNVIDTDDCTAGATFITFWDALKLTKEINHPYECTVRCTNVNNNNQNNIEEMEMDENNEEEIEHDGMDNTTSDHAELEEQSLENDVNDDVITNNNENNNNIVKFIPAWPSILISIHPYCLSGAIPTTVMHCKRRKKDLSLLWILCTMIANVATLWEVINRNVSRDDNWLGWLLHYLTEEAHPMLKRRIRRNNPFHNQSKYELLNRLIEFVCPSCHERVQTIDDLIHAFRFVSKGMKLVEIGRRGRTFNNISNQWLDIDDTINVIMLYRKPNLVPDVVRYRNQDTSFNCMYKDSFQVNVGSISKEEWLTYKLQFLCTMEASPEMYDNDEILLDKWNGLASYRHLESSVDQWWIIKRERQPYENKYYNYDTTRTTNDRLSISVAPLPILLLENWKVAIYVRVKEKEKNNLQKEYLESMGGQTLICCQHHKLCFVCCKYQSDADDSNIITCCEDNCDCTIPYYECPMFNCSMNLCKKHFKRHYEESHNAGCFQYFVAREVEESYNTQEQMSQSSIMDHDINVDGGNIANQNEENNINYTMHREEVDHSIHERMNSEHGTNEDMNNRNVVDDEDNGSNVVFTLDDMSLSDDELEEDNELPTSITFNENNDQYNQQTLPIEDESMFMLDAREDDMGAAYFPDDNDVYNTIPMTDASHACVDEPIVGGPIGGHVLINASGQCLMRHAKSISHTRRDRGFLESIIATHRNHIPLLSPEAMMFPSIFWKQLCDGTLVGALPGVLSADTKICKEVNVASAYDHMKTRLLNPSLPCASNSRYLHYLFDVMCNLNLRGYDTEIVQKRGFESILQGCGINIISDARSGNLDQHTYCCDVIDGRTSVNCLGAMMRQYDTTYFVTQTMNADSYPGVANITEHVNQFCNEQLMKEDHMNRYETKESCNAIHSATLVPTYRLYRRNHNLLHKWITTSVEQPFGKIDADFGISENQEQEKKASGTFNHFHHIYMRFKNRLNANARQKLLSCICCSSDTMFGNKDEVQYLIQNGILKNEEETCKVQALAKIIATHKCPLEPIIKQIGRKYKHAVPWQGKMGRCMIRNRDNTVKCRKTDYAEENPNPLQYGFKKFKMNHADEAMKIFEELKLLKSIQNHEYDENDDSHAMDMNCNKWKIYDEKLIEGMYVYPATKHELFSPLNVTLFSIIKSSCNVKCCDHYMSNRYLSKYAAGVDDDTIVHIKAQQGTGHLQVQTEYIGNVKITSNRIAQIAKENKKYRRTHHNIVGRMISDPEIIGLILKYPQVRCSETFIRIPTVPLEDRPGVKKRPKLCFQDACTATRFVHDDSNDISSAASPIEYRQNLRTLGIDRKFTSTELIIIRDQLCAPVSIDNMTSFGIRPPELRFVNSPTDYLCSFIIRKESLKKVDIINDDGTKSKRLQSITERDLHFDLFKSGWIDGMDRKVYLRKAGIQNFIQLYDDKFPDDKTRLLFHSLYYCIHQEFHSSTTINMQHQIQFKINDPEFNINQFIHNNDNANKLPIPVYNCIKPNNIMRFLIHIVLSLGRFNNEVELWDATDIRTVFQNAHLLPQQLNETNLNEAIQTIMKRYIQEQLHFIPSGTMSFDKYVIAAKYSIQRSLLENTINDVDLPSCLYTSLFQNANELCKTYNHKFRTNITTKLCENIDPDAYRGFTVDDFINATKKRPLQWFPTFTSAEGQSNESLAEQSSIITYGMNKIQSFSNGSLHSKRHIIFVGNAGTGKTYLQDMLALYATSLGLNVLKTSLIARNAESFGGIHLHAMLKLVANNKGDNYKTSDKALERQFRNPLTVNLLQSIDVLIIDEAGLIEAEIMSTLDIMLRYIRKSRDVMGGVQVIGSMDVSQLGTVDGKPFLISPNIVTGFDIIKVEHFVRSRHDQCLQELILLMSKDEWNEQTEQRFIDIIATKCNHVTSWNDPSITTNMTRIFGQHAAIKESEKMYINHHIINNNLTVRTRIALDEQRSRSTYEKWTKADENVTNILNQSHSGKQVHILSLFHNAIMEMTCNEPNRWSQGQLCIIRNLPSQQTLDEWKPIEVFLAPLGIKITMQDLENKTDNDLIAEGYEQITITKRNAYHEISISKSTIARRIQYPIRSRMSSTFHHIMGETLIQIITQVSDVPGNIYYIWNKGQVVVLLTRTKYLKDITFVSPHGAIYTAKVLLKTLKLHSQFYCYMKHIVQNCGLKANQLHNINENCIMQPVQEVRLDKFPFRPTDMTIPSSHATPGGFVYLFFSLYNKQSIQIGETNNLCQELRHYNRGFIKRSHLNLVRPWCPLIYVTGFTEDDTYEKHTFTVRWKEWTMWNKRNKRQLPQHTSLDIIFETINKCKEMATQFNNNTSRSNPLTIHYCFDFDSQ
jgi:hypothetical protein